MQEPESRSPLPGRVTLSLSLSLSCVASGGGQGQRWPGSQEPEGADCLPMQTASLFEPNHGIFVGTVRGKLAPRQTRRGGPEALSLGPDPGPNMTSVIGQGVRVGGQPDRLVSRASLRPLLRCLTRLLLLFFLGNLGDKKKSTLPDCSGAWPRLGLWPCQMTLCPPPLGSPIQSLAGLRRVAKRLPA
ncbi:hypothetical protein LY78DRAFT_489161 [Colletotrichum sublineola]|nr:hypothetical protein LY78DRAFT_489161 [Colletotrichum sublineola]